MPQTFTLEDKTLGFVFELTGPNKKALQILADNFEDLAKNISNLCSKWFTNYVAYGINGQY